MPRAFLSGWQITGLAGTGIAKTHGQNGDLTGVIEGLCADPHPFAQALAAGVVKGHAAFEHLASWCLTRNQNPCACINLQHRARHQVQFSQRGCTERTGSHVLEQGYQGRTPGWGCAHGLGSVLR